MAHQVHAIRAVVSGHVQGVGFRAYVLREARRLGVRGSVWNRADGCVELVAEHEDEARVNALVESLRHGPGRVTHVEVVASTPTGAGEFTVEYGG
jgi:acylphosphatase